MDFVKIKLTELPHREHRIDIETGKQIFGGCLTYWQYCALTVDCCNRLNCVHIDGPNYHAKICI